MMLFDPRSALEEIRNQQPTPATPATSATQTTQNAPNVARVANVATPKGQISKNADAPAAEPMGDMRHGFAINGHPLTWSGSIVSLGEWQNLTQWQRHGPDGRMWCGVSKVWSRDCDHKCNDQEDV